MSRIAYRVAGRPNVHPLDAGLNLPEAKHSHGLRKLAAMESARGSIEAAGATVTRATGAPIGKRQLEELARRCAAHVEALRVPRDQPGPGQTGRWCVSWRDAGLQQVIAGAEILAAGLGVPGPL